MQSVHRVLSPQHFIFSRSVDFWPEGSIQCHSVEQALDLNFTQPLSIRESIPAMNTDQRPKFVKAFDRDLFEHTPAGCQEVMAAHEVGETCPRHLQPEVISRKVGCTIREAVDLADALAILDADEKMFREVCRWARLRGVEATLRYLHPFLVGIAEAEAPADDDFADMTNTQMRKHLVSHGAKPVYGRHHLIAAMQRLEESLRPHSEPETIGYHKLGDDGADDWIERQPAWFQKLIETVRETKDYEVLKRLGKAVFMGNVRGDQASVFWGYYNARKKYIEARQAKTIRPVVNKLLAPHRIGRSPGARRAQPQPLPAPEGADPRAEAQGARVVRALGGSQGGQASPSETRSGRVAHRGVGKPAPPFFVHHQTPGYAGLQW